jgi:hypothetical protein
VGERRGVAIDRGLDWLVGAQADTGELPSYASPLGAVDPEWTPDTLKFISALVAVACAEIDDQRARDVVDGVVRFLRVEREPGGLWRYWSRSSEQFGYTPPDADDTACCSMAVGLRGDECRSNRSLLLANRDEHGRFYTWLIPQGHRVRARDWWTLRDELRAETVRRREELWSSSEAQPNDVDAVVNVNVIRYLGPELAPDAVTSWIREIIASGGEIGCDSWHRNRYTLYSAVADAARRGIAGLDALDDIIRRRIEERIGDDGGVGAPLDTAMALLALRRFGVEGSTVDRLASSLIGSQAADGSWSRSVFYFGGPDEVFGWASEALSTATAIAALAAVG